MRETELTLTHQNVTQHDVLIIGHFRIMLTSDLCMSSFICIQINLIVTDPNTYINRRRTLQRRL